MKSIIKRAFPVLVLTGLWVLDFAPETPLTPVFVGNAHAIVGAPLTPVSVAGVARRTTRRAVYASSASASAEASQQQQQQQAAPPPAPAAAAAPPAGSVVTALPAGCESIVVDGVNLFNCAGVMYQPSFQSNNLVYVVK